MEVKDRDFHIGAMWATSTMWRIIRDSVAIKDMLNEMDAHDIARYSAEYDIQPLRLNVMQTLPLGGDAEYVSISYGLISSLGQLVCDHCDAEKVTEDEFDSYGVYAVESDGSRTVLVAGMFTEEEAEGLAETLSEQLAEIMSAREDKLV